MSRNDRSTIPWLRFVGLTASAWAIGTAYAWELHGSGRSHFDSEVSSWLLALFGAFAPLALALLWAWPPLSRPRSAAAAVMLAGIVHTLVFVTRPRDPGAEYLDHWALYTSITWIAAYAVPALVVWCCLWLVARALHRQPAT